VAVEAAPGFTVKLPEAFAVLIVPSLAVMDRFAAPATVGVTLMLSTSPPDTMAAGTVPTKAFDVRFTVPVYPDTVFPPASWAVTRTRNAVPAVLATADNAVVPPDMVTANFAALPAVNATVALSVIAEEFNVAVTVAVPEESADVSVAEYVPFPLSVVPVMLPRFVPITTAAPPRSGCSRIGPSPEP